MAAHSTTRSVPAAALVWALAAALPAQGPPARDARAALEPEHRALLERAAANQHHNDKALAVYERYERHIARQENDQTRVVEDKTFRVVPTGTGTLKLVVEESGRKISPDFYRKQLGDLERALAGALNPNDRAQKERVEKFQRRQRERAELVDAMRDAFRYSFLGRETKDGRTLVKFRLEPNPDYRPRSRTVEILLHARATIWVDEEAAQLVRGEAEIIRDISFGGGVLGKVYRGGQFILVQAPAGEGLWMPARYEYDFSGRKFLFSFDVNETTEIRGYRRVGPPAEALAIIRRELREVASGSSGGTIQR